MIRQTHGQMERQAERQGNSILSDMGVGTDVRQTTGLVASVKLIIHAH